MGESLEARFIRRVERVVAVRPGEVAALLWSFGYFFALLAGYYVLRPLRDQMGIAGGVQNLPWMFTATFLAMLAVQPIYGAAVARLPRRRFIPLVYHFFVANIAIFWLLLTVGIARVEVAWAFFVWVSVFNLFAVSVFWSFLADLFSSEDGKRLFGFIGAGGTAGSLLGPTIALWLAGPLGPTNLLIVAALFIEFAVFCAFRLERAGGKRAHSTAAALDHAVQRVGGGWLAGIIQLFRSFYLAGAAIWVSLLSFTGTMLYLQQAALVAAAAHGATAQTRVFAGIDLAVGLMTLALQGLVTGRFIRRLGVGIALAFQPIVFAIGFAAVALAPEIGVVVVLQAIQRTANFAISNPARQILFTAVSREQKYKAKNVIDVVVVRGSDALYGWVYASFKALGLAVPQVAAIAAPVALAWAVLSLALGRAQARRAAADELLAARSP